MRQAFKLNPPKLDVARPAWLFAKTFGLSNRTGLMVYRSLWLDEADEWLDEVWQTVKRHRLQLGWKGRFVDVDMTFSQGELSVYLSTAEGDPDPELVEEAKQQGLKLIKERAC